MKNCFECVYSGVRLQADQSMGHICRLNPPTVVAFPVPGPTSVQLANVTMWPTVEESDWCSKFASKLSG
jgi:hypothetical protein